MKNTEINTNTQIRERIHTQNQLSFIRRTHTQRFYMLVKYTKKFSVEK